MKKVQYFCDVCDNEVTIDSPELNITIELNYNETKNFIACSECLRENTFWKLANSLIPDAPVGFKPNQMTRFHYNCVVAVQKSGVAP